MSLDGVSVVISKRFKPAPDWLRRYAKLADRGLNLDEIAG
jgi:hypothetical protein